MAIITVLFPIHFRILNCNHFHFPNVFLPLYCVAHGSLYRLDIVHVVKKEKNNVQKASSEALSFIYTVKVVGENIFYTIIMM